MVSSLSEWVESARKKGHSNRDIKRRLQRAGYPDKEIDAALKKKHKKSHHKKKSKKKLPERKKPRGSFEQPKIPGIVYGAVILLVVAVLTLFWFVVAAPSDASSPLPGQAGQPLSPRIQSPPVESPHDFSDVLDCSDNYLCLRSAATTCSHKSGQFTFSTDFFGIITTTRANLAISGTELCMFTYEVLDSSVAIHKDTRASMRADGLSDEQISSQEAAASAQAAESVGTKYECEFTSSKLLSLLVRWESGEFSGGVSCTIDGSNECTPTGDFEGCTYYAP